LSRGIKWMFKSRCQKPESTGVNFSKIFRKKGSGQSPSTCPAAFRQESTPIYPETEPTNIFWGVGILGGFPLILGVSYAFYAGMSIPKLFC